MGPAEARPVQIVASTTAQKIQHYADVYNVSADLMSRLVMCESTGSSTIQSFLKDPRGPNGREDSWGLVQINLPYHPDVSREQAIDPDFALDFMGKWLSKGRYNMWACYKIINQ